MWAPIGVRPQAVVHHRCQWVYVTAFVQPHTGRVAWWITNSVDKPLFAAILEAFARLVGAGRQRIVVLVIDNAGWHTPTHLSVPDGLRLVYLPPYTPELQPAECLWQLVDEPIVNKCFDTLRRLADAVAKRCVQLIDQADDIRNRTSFHWWPKTITPK